MIVRRLNQQCHSFAVKASVRKRAEYPGRLIHVLAPAIARATCSPSNREFLGIEADLTTLTQRRGCDPLDASGSREARLCDNFSPNSVRSAHVFHKTVEFESRRG